MGRMKLETVYKRLETFDKRNFKVSVFRALKNAPQEEIEYHANEASKYVKRFWKAACEFRREKIFAPATLILEFFHVVGTLSDKWLVALGHAVVPFLYDEYRGVLRSFRPGEVPAGEKVSLVISPDLQTNQPVVEFLSSILDLCIDNCDLDARIAEAHALKFVYVTSAILLGSSFNQPRRHLNSAVERRKEAAVVYASDTLQRNASYCLFNIIDTFSMCAEAAGRVLEARLTKIMKAIAFAPEITIQRSLIRIAKLLYDRKTTAIPQSRFISDANQVFAIIDNAQPKSLQGATRKTFEAICLSAANADDHILDFRDKLSYSQMNGANSANRTGRVISCSVSLVTRGTSSTQKHAPALSEWNSRSLSVRHTEDETPPRRYPFHEIKKISVSRGFGTVKLDAKLSGSATVCEVCFNIAREKLTFRNHVLPMLRRLSHTSISVSGNEEDLIEISELRWKKASVVNRPLSSADANGESLNSDVKTEDSSEALCSSQFSVDEAGDDIMMRRVRTLRNSLETQCDKDSKVNGRREELDRKKTQTDGGLKQEHDTKLVIKKENQDIAIRSPTNQDTSIASRLSTEAEDGESKKARVFSTENMAVDQGSLEKDDDEDSNYSRTQKNCSVREGELSSSGELEENGRNGMEENVQESPRPLIGSSSLSGEMAQDQSASVSGEESIVSHDSGHHAVSREHYEADGHLAQQKQPENELSTDPSNRIVSLSTSRRMNRNTETQDPPANIEVSSKVLPRTAKQTTGSSNISRASSSTRRARADQSGGQPASSVAAVENTTDGKRKALGSANYDIEETRFVQNLTNLVHATLKKKYTLAQRIKSEARSHLAHVKSTKIKHEEQEKARVLAEFQHMVDRRKRILRSSQRTIEKARCCHDKRLEEFRGVRGVLLKDEDVRKARCKNIIGHFRKLAKHRNRALSSVCDEEAAVACQKKKRSSKRDDLVSGISKLLGSSV